MRIFSFPPAAYAGLFASQGFVCIRNGVTAAFFDFAWRQLQERRVASGNIASRYDKRGMKEQYLFDFPPDEPAIVDAVEALATLTGLPAADIVLSERHYKVYAADADPNPTPHKDRCSSQISLGIPLVVPEVSRVVLYPHHERWPNPFDSYDELLRSQPPEQRPEITLRGVEPVEVRARPGDVLVFFGADMYHERLDGAGTHILYLKWNALGLDPIGENLACLPLAQARRRPARAMS